jgi:hypothetical protein
MLVHVNYLAVVVCAIASMVVGWVWYGPLFGKTWMKAMGMNPNMSPEEMKSMQKDATPGYVAMVAGALVMAYSLDRVMSHFGVIGLQQALKVAGEIWLGFVATVFLGGVFFEKRGWTHYFLTVGFQLVNMLVYALILVSWK